MLFGVNTKLDFFTILKLLLPFPFIYLSPWGLPALLPGLLPLLSSVPTSPPEQHNIHQVAPLDNVTEAAS